MQTGSFQPLSSQGNFYRKLDQANSSEIENAFSLILNEISKRDQRIRELEEQLLSLQKQLSNKNNTYQNIPTNNTLQNILSGQDSPFRNLGQDFSSNRIGYNSDSEKKVKIQIPKPSSQTPSNSFIVNNNNSSAYLPKDSSQSRNEVKKFLNEVKGQVEPKLFKEFIKNIKLLTNKTGNNVNRKAIIENVKNLFGEQHKDLFLKFEEILGVKKK